MTARSDAAAGPRIGFVGIGNMGWPMAANLVRAGRPVTVFDADPSRCTRFVSEMPGAEAAADTAALGRQADLVITMLPDGRLVRDVLTGAGRLVDHLQHGSVVVDMSSSDPMGTRQLGAALLERGIRLLDAPVSGLVPRAVTGTLTIMIGGDDEAAIGRASPILACLGERLFRVGGLGCGHAMKALNNLVAATAFTATAEALIVGKRFGLDPGIMIQVLNVSSGRSFHSDVSFPDQVLTRRFASGFALGLLAKDVGIASALADQVAATVPLAQLVSRLWAEGCEQVGPGADNSAIIEHWERLNDVVIGTI